LSCDGSNSDICVEEGEKVTVYNKIGGRLKIPVLRSLTLENIIIDSSDSNIIFSDDCASEKQACCSTTDISDENM